MSKIELEIPTLILVAGVSASGKTTLSKELARSVYDVAPIDKDTINEAFLATHADSDTEIHIYRLSGPTILREHEHYQNHVRFQSYHAMLGLAMDLLLVGNHPLLDGNYAKEIHRGYIDAIITPFFQDIPHQRKLIFCHADKATIRRRLVERGSPRDKVKLESEEAWRIFLEEEPILPSELERYDHVKIDTTLPLNKNVLLAIEYLRA